MQFRDLQIGQAFDFVTGDRLLDSFTHRCVKLSPRTYCDGEYVHRIGSITAGVYHVGQVHAINPAANRRDLIARCKAILTCAVCGGRKEDDAPICNRVACAIVYGDGKEGRT